MGLNDLIGLLLESIQNARDDWDTESSIQQADLAPSAHDTNILLAAITQGSGILYKLWKPYFVILVDKLL